MSDLKANIASTFGSIKQTSSTQIETLLTRIYTSLPPAIQQTLTTTQARIHESPYLTRTNIQFSLRIVVVIMTLLLFRPHLETLYRNLTNTPDPRKVELENRLRFLQDLKDGKVKPQGGVEIVDGKVVLKPHPKPTAQGKKNAKVGGKGKVVKLVVPGEGDRGGESAAGKDVGQEKEATSGKTASSSGSATPGKTRRRKG